MHTYIQWGTIYYSKDLEPTQMPISDRLEKENVAQIHHGMLCSHKNDEFMSFVGTWMNLETIILSKLTLEQKIRHHIFSLIGGCWTMKTHGHREGALHTGVYRGKRGGPVGGGGGAGLPGEKYQMWVKGRKQAKHTALCVPIQLYCMLCTCTPKPKMQ